MAIIYCGFINTVFLLLLVFKLETPFVIFFALTLSFIAEKNKSSKYIIFCSMEQMPYDLKLIDICLSQDLELCHFVGMFL